MVSYESGGRGRANHEGTMGKRVIVWWARVGRVVKIIVMKKCI